MCRYVNVYDYHKEVILYLPPGVMVDNANIVEADTLAANGYIHSIDRILTPEDLKDLV